MLNPTLTSSPNVIAVGSVSIAVLIPSFIAVNRFIRENPFFVMFEREEEDIG